MLQSFIAFHINGVSNFVYMITSNLSFFIIFISFLWMVFLYLKQEVENATGEEQIII